MVLLVPIMFLPVVFAALCGVQADRISGDNDDIWMILLLVFLVLEVAGLITFLVLGISTKKKLRKASIRVYELLRDDYSVIVTQPATLVIQTGSGKTVLISKAVPAVDSDRNPIIISLRTDDSGTKIIPTLHH